MTDKERIEDITDKDILTKAIHESIVKEGR